MEYFRITYCGILLTSMVFTFIISIYSFYHKGYLYKYFFGLNLCVAVYSLGYAMELYGDSLGNIEFWNYIQYLGLPYLASFWLLFFLEYANKPLKKSVKIIVYIIPTLTVIFRFTSHINHLYYRSIHLIDNGYFNVLSIHKGPWYWVQVIFETCCFIITNYLFIKIYRNSKGVIRRQALILLSASLLPWVTVFMNIFNIPAVSIDFAPFALSLSILMFLFALLRFQLLNIKPMARDKFFQSTDNGVIVLDSNYKIIDYNPASVLIFPNLNESIMGKDIRESFRGYEEIISSIINANETQFSIINSNRTYKVKSVEIHETKASLIGYIVTVTDITKYIEMMDELSYIASRDVLTGVYNRRYFNELSLKELENARTKRKSITMIILDVDHFKNVNDRYGHQAGDMVLKNIADVCQHSIRTNDILGRYGGEEFVIFLPNTTYVEAQVISNRILNNIESLEIIFNENIIKVTVSIGFVSIQELNNENMDFLLSKADKALYAAKSDGRNCIRFT